ncbi:MAG: phospho-sugar mutase [Bacteroidales bacterium]|nr:phospho-sugar mutase [Bacteroidales bacterium]
MAKKQIDPAILERANEWLAGGYDQETKATIRDLMENNPDELTESFYRDLEFGTGGLRGIIGVGTNRMNKYTVGAATQGLANYIKKVYPKGQELRAAISYDCRNKSDFFARVTADVLTANGFKVYLFDELRPTPELSFAIRHFKCQTGVMITASHNPKEYNGYKAYWDDGAQMIPPHDKNVIEEVKKIKISDVKFKGKKDSIVMIGEEVDTLYLDEIKKLTLSPGAINRNSELKIVYTPLHGTGVKLVPEILDKFGFENVFKVYAQDVTDGDFPTVVSPNPEEPAALQMALEKAVKVDAELVMATDPDADRVGIAVKNLHENLVLLNGNQTASVLFYYMLTMWDKKDKLTGNEFIVKTIVTTELAAAIAKKFGVECFDCLTGFKWIANVIRENEGKKTFIVGGEESYGYMIGDFVRDKDAVASCAMIAEVAAWAASQRKSFFDVLVDIYIEFGFYKESLLSVTKKGKAGAEEIQKMMENFRTKPPKKIDGSDVVLIKDYLEGKSRDAEGNETPIDLPKSNVLQFFTADGTKISMRPSGTEPKIKFYFGVKDELPSKEMFDEVDAKLEAKIDAVIKDLKLK